eukprot:3590109-Heterocapsa_arctica.AAC.1
MRCHDEHARTGVLDVDDHEDVEVLAADVGLADDQLRSDSNCAVEFCDVIAGPGLRLRPLRLEAVHGGVCPHALS